MDAPLHSGWTLGDWTREMARIWRLSYMIVAAVLSPIGFTLSQSGDNLAP
jgi:hypothetical protein